MDAAFLGDREPSVGGDEGHWCQGEALDEAAEIAVAARELCPRVLDGAI